MLKSDIMTGLEYRLIFLGHLLQVKVLHILKLYLKVFSCSLLLSNLRHNLRFGQNEA